MDPIDLALEAAQSVEPAPEAEEPVVNPEAEPEAAPEPPTEAPPDEGKEPPKDDPKRRQKDLDRQAQDLRKKEQKFQATKERTLAEKAKAREALDQVEALRKGDARAILSSLGTLTGRDPIELLRELNLNLATDGKKPASVAESEALSALKKEIEALKAEQQKREAVEKTQAIESRVRQELGALVIADTFPELAAYAKEVGAEKAAAEMRQAMGALAQRGENVTTYDVCARAEVGLRKARAAQPKTTPGSDTRAAPAAKTEQGQSTPRGQSLAPSVASQATRARPLTDEERHREQVRLTEGVLADLGLG
jgi:hypothetical protein